MSKVTRSQKDAMSISRNAVENAAAVGPWMAVVWSLELGEVKMQRVTWEFPKVKMKESIEMLTKDLRGEQAVVPMLSDDPLPKADVDRPRTIQFPHPPSEPCCDEELVATPDELQGIVEVTPVEEEVTVRPPIDNDGGF